MSDVSKKNKKTILISIAVVLFLGFTVFVLFLFGGEEEEEATTRARKKEVTSAFVPEITTEAITEATTQATTEITTEITTETTTEKPTEATKTDAVASRDYSDYFRDDRADTEKPVFLINYTNVSLVRGEAFDVHSYIGYGDDVDRDVELTVDGEVDTSTLGSYVLNLTLTDDAGHTNSSKLSVNVVSSKPETPAKETESWKTFTSTYAGEGRSFGIDVSRWQNTIDFEKVKAAGCDYVIMRIGGYDEGEHYTDRCYAQNIRNAKAAGLKIGIYWHAEESSKDEVIASAKYLLDVLDGEKLDFPIAYDWEDFENFERYGMNIQDLNDCYHIFKAEMEAAGYEASIYGSKNFMYSVWTDKGDEPVWLAHYTSGTDYTGNYYMWQQTSRGSIDGISGNVDFNVYYKKDQD